MTTAVRELFDDPVRRDLARPVGFSCSAFAQRSAFAAEVVDPGGNQLHLGQAFDQPE